MNVIKKLRQEFGYTQVSLVEKTGLSLRTIQRIETSNKPPKGHTLIVLSEVFNIEPSILQEKIKSNKRSKDSDKLSIRLINLSILAVFIIPFGNLILPFILWSKKRESKIVDQIARRIINFQIIWTISLSFLLCISPFINSYIFPSVSLILIVLFTAMIINMSVVFSTAYFIHRDKMNFLNIPLRLL